MVAGVARNSPENLTDDPSASADAPALLSHPLPESPPLSPATDLTELAEVHRRWAEIHRAARPPTTGPGWRGAVRARTGVAEAESVAHEQRQDRALIGELIRLAEALAVRCDELAQRVQALEGSLREVTEVLGQDLVALRAKMPTTDAADGR
jgi:hypothetical protein